MRILLAFALVAVCSAADLRAAGERSSDTTAVSGRSVLGVLKAIDTFASVVNKAGDVFGSESTSGFASKLSNVVGVALPLLELILGKPEDPTLVAIRKEFKKVNSRLDGIDLKLSEILKLIKWTSTLKEYSGYEKVINIGDSNYKKYVEATSASSRRTYRTQFMNHYKNHVHAAENLYNGIMKNRHLSTNLAKAVRDNTGQHRKNVQKFLMQIIRLIVRGSQLHIAYAAFDSRMDPKDIEKDWKSDIRKLPTELKRIEDEVKKAMPSQFKVDAREMMSKSSDYKKLSNKDFVTKARNFLDDKYDWQNWIVVAYKDVSGYDKHTITQNGGDVYFRVSTNSGRRNFAIGRANKRGSSWKKSSADQALKVADSKGSISKDAKYWHDIVNKLYPVNSRAARFIAVVCWGCDFWYHATSNSRNVAYRAIKGAATSERVHALIFG